MSNGRAGLACAGLALAAGCSAAGPFLRRAPPAPIATAQEVLEWEGLARPDTMLMLTAFVSPLSSVGPCPRTEVVGSRTLVTGGCVDHRGATWFGQAELEQTGGTTVAWLRGFGPDDTRTSGTVHTNADPDAPLRFSLDVEVIASELAVDGRRGLLAVRYAGGRDGQQWFGAGRLAQSGRGQVRVQTTGLVFDETRCRTEPLRGHTKLSAGRHEVALQYDGLVDCDDPGTAQWSVDGKPQGELSGVSSSTMCTPSRDSSPLPVGTMLVLLGVPGLRRRRAGKALGRSSSCGR